MDRVMIYGDFTPSESAIRTHELAHRYVDETEAYDKTVCSGKNERGVAMPTSPYEVAAINRNALKVRKQILMENPDIPWGAIHKIIPMLDPTDI